MRTGYRTTLILVIGAGIAAGALAAESDVGSPDSVNPSAIERVSETTNVKGTAEGGCPFFLNPTWTLYANVEGELWVKWNVVSGMAGNMRISLTPSGGYVASVPSASGSAKISVIDTEIDPFPPGYALAPGPIGSYQVRAEVKIGGWTCANTLDIGALPPPTTVALKSEGPAVEPGGIYGLLFDQKFPLTVANTILYYIPSPQSIESVQGIQFPFGGTATVGSDFTGPASNPYSGTTITYPAHEQKGAISLSMLDDDCPEPTEDVVTHWIYESDASWGLGNLSWALLGAPSYTFDILDDDAGRPHCAIQHDLDSF